MKSDRLYIAIEGVFIGAPEERRRDPGARWCSVWTRRRRSKRWSARSPAAPLPLRAGRATRHTHDYKRHGDLYAALEVVSAQVTQRVTATHGVPSPVED